MRVIRAASAAEFAHCAAERVGMQLKAGHDALLALPTGRTPAGLYAELIARTKGSDLNLATARLCNLDEYVGLPSSDPHSYAAYLERHLIAPLGLAPGQTRWLRGDADPQSECRAYDESISAAGGIDLCILGLGANGHIAFNEPGCGWERRTHIVELTTATREAQERHAAAPWKVPTHGITMGLRTILESRHLLLLIAGEEKAAARAALYRGVPDPAWPVTSLLAHPDLTIIETCEFAARR